MSEIVAEAPVRAKSALATLTEGNTVADMRARYGSASLLLEQASRTEDEQVACYSGDSDRLLRVAADFATYRAHSEGFEASELQNDAYTVSALISAARLVPGDFEYENRTNLIDQAIALLRPVASDEEGGAAEFGLPMAPRPERTKPNNRHEQIVVDTLHALMGKAADAQELPADVATLMDMVDLKLDGPGLKDGMFCDVAALIAGMLSLIREDQASTRGAIDALTQARELAESTFISYGSGMTGAVACADGIRAAQAATVPPQGLNAAQFRIAMEVIAGRTATLHRLVMLSNDPCQDDFVRSVCGDAAEVVATTVGALADEAVGGGIVGNANHWHYGPSFEDAGKAGAA